MAECKEKVKKVSHDRLGLLRRHPRADGSRRDDLRSPGAAARLAAGGVGARAVETR